MELADTTRAIAYFRNPSDVPLWSDYFSRCGISGIPVVILCCDVCRDDLLFELELEASALTG
jgi:hypothetical protein